MSIISQFLSPSTVVDDVDGSDTSVIVTLNLQCLELLVRRHEARLACKKFCHKNSEKFSLWLQPNLDNSGKTGSV